MKDCLAGFLLVGWGARSLGVERPGDGSDAITDVDLLLHRVSGTEAA